MASSSSYPTLYEYYTKNGITAGLSTDHPDYFTLNHRQIQIFSGALHYFRIPPQYWRDRLRKVRAAGLNCVETYIPWNLHQPQSIERFDFGDGKTEFSQFLNITNFIKLAQDEDLFVIIRPGPYICAEWEFGGLPSWLLREPNLKIRTSDPKFIDFVRRYFKNLLAILAPLQFIKGGPIILFQIENEYGNTKINDQPIDRRYLEILNELFHDNGIVELLCTSDTPSQGFSGTLPHILATANFQNDPIKELQLLRDYQPNKPLMVMEYWTGWYDHWTEQHHTRRLDDFIKVFEEIISFKASVNQYMFHGGTNWGFLNGADLSDTTTDNSAYQPVTTSYDYDAPLTEAGDYTDKYFKVKELLEKYNEIKTRTPPLPPLVQRIAYRTIEIKQKLSIDDLIKQSANRSIFTQNLKSMELLDINNNSGQSYGYIVYRKDKLQLPPNSVLVIDGHVCDTVMVLIDGVLKSPQLQSLDDFNNFGYWRLKDSMLALNNPTTICVTLDLIVENWGRCNYGKLNQFNQYKGLWQGVRLNGEILQNFQIIPLEFHKSWSESLIDWRNFDCHQTTGPHLYRTCFDIDDGIIRDTFIDMRDWCKGFVIINGFVLGRYLKFGPQQSLYLPAPFLQQYGNVLMIFEHFNGVPTVKFSADAIFSNNL